MSFPNRLSSDQVGDLDKDISIDEIRKAVWDRGESKSPGPDGFTFEFFRRYWHFIGPDFYAAVNCFFDKGRFPRGSNSSFIALIPKVMDAKFVTDFRPISLIGSVYKVVTKILANRLMTVIFGLISNTQSAFVANRHILDGPFILNEVLTWCKRRRKQALVFKVEFAKAYDSVRWDFLLDVLLAFDFGSKWCQWIRGIFSSNMASILINRSPSSEFLIFSGLKQDDAVFIEEWSIENLDNLLKILNCFHLASGLCINVNKSHVLGIGVPLDIVCQAWSNTIQKVRGHLTRWKVKTLSIGGRLSLFKSVLGAVPIYNDSKITWVAWAKVLLSKKNRGLGVSSFFALNRALLLKWVWRYLVQDGSLWYHIISAIYGSRLECHSPNILFPWGVILREVHQLASKCFNFHSHCKIRVEDGLNTSFWFDTWILNFPLNVRFPRLFALELDKDISVAAKWSAPRLTLLSEGMYEMVSKGISDIRSELDNLFLPSSAVATRWVNLVPIKVNIFAWRVSIDRLLTREFVVGGTFNGRRSRLSLIGLLGSVLFVCRLSLKQCWRVFSTLLVGMSGPFGIEDPKTHTVGEVWSGEYMDHGFTKSMSELDRCYTMLQELHSMIIVEGYQVCRVPMTKEKSYKVEVLCILDDIDECHILLGRPWRCEVNGKYDVKQNLYIFSGEGRRIAMVPPKVTSQLPKPEVKIEENIVKAKVVDEHIEKIQDIQNYKQEDDKVSTSLFETTNKVGTLKTLKTMPTKDATWN
uniref:RNA-directed DNA polymerase, eukaryota n=1 Tax=Tanacetum cinerariifolium TaxID=118510 RepID=A0A699GX35_TANCI|nr:RNA-directed DNA polymerase, eukaryota [Tanacetum cinerariifolium]